MSVRPPHFLLFSGACRSDDTARSVPDSWRFVLESVNGTSTLEATDLEPDAAGERLELLSVVRGLEALDQPSRVTLVTPSRYISSGLSYGMSEWRDNNWRWERFGQRVPVKHADLWKRIDGALKFHRVECKFWRFDDSESRPPSQEGPAARTSLPAQSNGCGASKWRRWSERLWGPVRRWLVPAQPPEIAGC